MSEDVTQPTEYNVTILTKFIEAFNNGYNVTEACQYAGVARMTYYRWIEDIPGFKDRCEEAKLMINRKAKEVIVKSISDGDAGSAKWWLERKDPDFKNKAAVEIDPNEEKIEEIIKGLTDDPANKPSLPDNGTTAAPDTTE